MRLNDGVIMLLKRLAVVVVLLLLSPLAWLVRENIAYRRYTSKLESAHSQLKSGMSENQVNQLLGAPDSVTREDSGEILYWSARDHQGWLFEKLPIATTKGHYDLTVKLDNQGNVISVWGGIN
jgi:hypothetical protein